jgi:hypothetical protein
MRVIPFARSPKVPRHWRLTEIPAWEKLGEAQVPDLLSTLPTNLRIKIQKVEGAPGWLEITILHKFRITLIVSVKQWRSAVQ